MLKGANSGTLSKLISSLQSDVKLGLMSYINLVWPLFGLHGRLSAISYLDFPLSFVNCVRDEYSNERHGGGCRFVADPKPNCIPLKCTNHHTFIIYTKLGVII